MLTRLPATERVFEIRGVHYAESDDGPQVRAGQAESVALIDMRPRTLSVTTSISPPRGASACALRVSFRCQVKEPTIVAQARLVNIFPDLVAFVHRNQRVQFLMTGHSLDSLHEVYFLIQRRFIAQHHVEPVDIPGMRVMFTSAEFNVK